MSIGGVKRYTGDAEITQRWELQESEAFPATWGNGRERLGFSEPRILEKGPDGAVTQIPKERYHPSLKGHNKADDESVGKTTNWMI